MIAQNCNIVPNYNMSISALNFFSTITKLSVFFLLVGCAGDKETAVPGPTGHPDPKIARLKLPEGFHAERLYGPSEYKNGSWVSMTFDDKGRMIASDQYGGLYRLQLPAIGDTITKVSIEKLAIPSSHNATDTAQKNVSIGYAHGLLWAFNSLYIMINHRSDSVFNKGSGLYRLQDTDGDDRFDQLTLLKALDGSGEHGPHSIVMSPDKKSLYVIAGNFTKIPEMNGYKNLADGKTDNLLPLLKDPNGHDDVVHTEGGWIAHVDSAGKHWELVSSGYRNPFDLAFNDEGDMFTYDSDMEWDIGTPWYRPTRICHAVSGGEFGWRPGSAKWSPFFADNLPAMVNVGQGSPTNLVYGGSAGFPEKYRQSLFAFDWSFGIIYAFQLEQDGATYKAKGEEFISGSPLPLTDGAIGPDGALYFLTGGRELESDLYRVYYGDGKQNKESLAIAPLNEKQQLRRKIEAFHDGPKKDAVDFVWPYLKDEDRFIRYASRVALEHQPVALWQNKALGEKDPAILIQAAIALARRASPSIRERLVRAIASIDYAALPASLQLDMLRSLELVFARMGKPGEQNKILITTLLEPHYPASNNNELNRQLSKILLYLEDPAALKKTVELLASAKDEPADGQTFMRSSDLIMRNLQYGLDIASTLSKMPPLQQSFYAVALTQVKSGWTAELQEKYYRWFYEAFNFRGGVSFKGFINNARKNALQQVAKERFDYFNQLSGDSIANLSGTDLVRGAPQPKGPGRDWETETAVTMLDSGLANRNFEQGKGMFAALYCIACHAINGEGGAAGPDLSQLKTRFSNKDIIEAIMDPGKTISDQYVNTIFYLKEGGTVTGRIVSQDGDKYTISQNPFSTQTLLEIKKNDVVRTSASAVSAMPPRLINRLNSEELKDLVAYLKSGGNKQDSVFTRHKK